MVIIFWNGAVLWRQAPLIYVPLYLIANRTLMKWKLASGTGDCWHFAFLGLFL